MNALSSLHGSRSPAPYVPDFYGAQELFSLLKKRMGAEIVS